ncbi:MAG: DUF748 domain-containing protein [Mariprofundaceae bacterium]|nr:DUF748 domain-containing protein [Mariprofundaceae bacterium]
MSESGSTITAMLKKQQRLFSILAAITAATLLLLSLIPSVVHWRVASWLEGQGAQVEIENVDLNLFKGTFVIEGVSVDTGLKVGRLAIDIDWWPMFDQRIFIRSIELKGIKAEIQQRENGEWQVATIPLGAPAPDTPQPVEPWQIVLNDIGVADVSLKVNGKMDQEPFELSLLLNSLKASLDKREDDGGQWLKNSVDLGSVIFSAPGYTVKNRSLQLENTLFLPAVGRDIAAEFKISHMNLNLRSLSITDNHDQSLAVDGLHLAQAGGTGSGTAAFDLLSVQGVALQAEEDDAQISIREFSLQGAQLDFSGTHKLDRASIQGLQAAVNVSTMETAVAAGASRTEGHHRVQLLAIDSIDMDQATVADNNRAAFELLSMQGIRLPATSDDSLGSVGEVSLHSAEIDFSGDYKLNRVAVRDLRASIRKLRDGRIPVLDYLQGKSRAGRTPAAVMEGGKESPARPPDVNKTVAEDTGEPVLYIDEFLVSEGSVVTYRDESKEPPFNASMAVETFTLAPFDSSGKKMGNLEVVIKLNRQGLLSVRGEIVPDFEAPFADLNVELKNADMQRLSGFVELYLGHSIKTGQLELSSSVKVAENRIDAKNRVVIRKLALQKAKQPGKAEGSLGMPVNMAIDLLRDSRGDIAMDVPISGRLDDPDVNLNDAIRQALSSAMSAGAVSYAKQLLQPYGTIITAVQMASDVLQKASRPKLTPVRFNERSSDLEPDMADYALKISLLMKQKDLRLQICGVATRIEGGGVTPDRPLIMNDEKLHNLAEARSDTVLKTIQDHGIASDRLYSCRPTIDEKLKNVSPRVELILD